MVLTCVGDLEADALLEKATTLWCGCFKNVATGEMKSFYEGSPDGFVPEMLAYMDKIDVLCMHNGVQFDAPLLEKLFKYEFKGKMVDTLLISRLHNPNRRLPPHCPTTILGPDGKNQRVGPHSVMAWGYRVGRGKVEHTDWTQFSPNMLHRCQEDVEVQHLIWQELQREAEGWDWESAYALTHRLFSILGKQEAYGWLVDQEHLAKSQRILENIVSCIDEVVTPNLPLILEIEESGKKDAPNWVKKPFKKNGEYSKAVLDWMKKLGVDPAHFRVGGPFTRIKYRPTNINSGMEVKDFLLKSGWKPQSWNTSKLTGERTTPKMTTDETFEGVEGRIGKLLAQRVVCRHRHSTLVGFERDLRPDGRLPARVTGLAVTGRATHGTIVNVPGSDSWFGRQMRKVFTCKQGYKLVSVDSAGCQNRMLAARVGDPFFTKTLLEGKKEDGTSIHHVNMKSIQKQFDENGYGHLKVTYHSAKTDNYATLFGASPKKLGSNYAAGPEVGELVKAGILGVAPGFQALNDSLLEEWQSTAKTRKGKYGKEYYDGVIEGLDGRPIRISSPHMILVYMLQSDEAVMMSAAYCFLYKWALARGWSWGDMWAYVCWYHDEYTSEVREDIAEEFCSLGEKAIVTAGEFYKIAIPHKGDGAIGTNWYEVH